MRRFVSIMICAVLGTACSAPQDERDEHDQSCKPMVIQRTVGTYHPSGDPDGLGLIIADIAAPCGAKLNSVTIGLYRNELNAQSFTRVPICSVLSCERTIELRTDADALIPTVLGDISANGSEGVSYQRDRDGGTFLISSDHVLRLWMPLRDLAEHPHAGVYSFMTERLEVMDDEGAADAFDFIMSAPFAAVN